MIHDELLLLGLLAQQQMHGYELHEFIEKRLHFLSDLTKPTAYRMLDALHQQGLVERRSERSGRRPERHVYSLTPAGGERLTALVRELLPQQDRVVYPGNAAVLFASRLPVGERRQLLVARRAAAADSAAELRLARDAHRPGSTVWAVLDHDLSHITAEIDWLDAEIDRNTDPSDRLSVDRCESAGDQVVVQRELPS